MANALWQPDSVMYKGMDLRRELVGLIPSVDVALASLPAAVNQTIQDPHHSRCQHRQHAPAESARRWGSGHQDT